MRNEPEPQAGSRMRSFAASFGVRVWGLGFWVWGCAWGSGFRVWDLRFCSADSDPTPQTPDPAPSTPGSGFGVWGFGFWSAASAPDPTPETPDPTPSIPSNRPTVFFTM